MNLRPKSRLTAFLLTFLFGPLGLFYCSGRWGCSTPVWPAPQRIR